MSENNPYNGVQWANSLCFAMCIVGSMAVLVASIAALPRERELTCFVLGPLLWTTGFLGAFLVERWRKRITGREIERIKAEYVRNDSDMGTGECNE